MQRAASCFAFVYVVLTTVACLDQGHNDRALLEVEAARRETQRDGRLQALEREHTLLMQQVALMTSVANSSFAQTSSKEDERDKRLAEVSAQIAGIGRMLSAWRDEERPQPVDPDARRIAEQGSAEDRAVALRKVQALLDAGRIKLTMRNGRIALAQVRPIDVTDPYQPPLATPAAIPSATPVVPKRPIDRLGF